MGKRDEEYKHGREESGEAARGLFFDCEFCIRPEDERYRGPTVDDDGNRLEPWDVLERYNQRRYAHLDTGFAGSKALREHLVDRAHYWARGSEGCNLASALSGIDATVAMMQQRRSVRAGRGTC